jgi:hypothetical protein
VLLRKIREMRRLVHVAKNRATEIIQYWNLCRSELAGARVRSKIPELPKACCHADEFVRYVTFAGKMLEPLVEVSTLGASVLADSFEHPSKQHTVRMYAATDLLRFFIRTSYSVGETLDAPRVNRE